MDDEAPYDGSLYRLFYVFMDPEEYIAEIPKTFVEWFGNHCFFREERAILAPKLDNVDEVNQLVLSLIPGDEKEYLSSDNPCISDLDDDIQSQWFTTEFLNEIKVSGLPNHKLVLKVGVPVMLLRNIDQANGLCNGTRLTITYLGKNVIGAIVITGRNSGNKVLIPRMTLIPTGTNLPLKFERRQFPLALCFAMTINKNQGQSLSHVGLYLPRPVFTHGQLYLALSRVRSKQGMKILIYDEDNKPTCATTNVVYKEVFEKVDIIGVGCYSSKDLWTWKHEGIVLAAEETNETHDLYKSNVLERPKVIFNDKTGKYVMWMHVDDANYTKASVGVAISDTPDGPFDYLGSQRPHGYESRDMTVFKDDDGVAYLIYSSVDNSELHIGPLTEDYLNVTSVLRRILVGHRREAPALFKHQGTYYMITSGCTGWAPNEALAHAAESILGPWETMGNPCIGGNKMFRLTTFFSQSTFVLPVPRFPGSFIFMADRWNPADLRDPRYVWLPLIVAGPLDQPLEYSFQFPLWSRVSIYWHRKWRLPQGWSRFK